jgi:nucleotide-binding universal stress UspA family protein
MLTRIALDLSKDGNHARRIQVAIQLAARHQAELIGVCPDIPIHPYMRGEGRTPEGIMATLLEQIAQEKIEIKKQFLKQAALAGIKAQCRMPKGSVQEVIIAAGRPVLVTPYIANPEHTVGKHVLFCWDYGRRSARALADAAPLLSNASTLTILTVDPPFKMLQTLDIQQEDMLAYCAAHGYPQPKLVNTTSEGVGIGNAILNAATDHACDLIVMGLYNRSRVREWILGGTSKTLLQSMTVPVLFSH